MDLELCFKVHNLVAIHLNSTKLGQIINLTVILNMVVSIYKLDTICNSTPSTSKCRPIILRFHSNSNSNSDSDSDSDSDRAP